jgi:hypothetical protein
MEYLDEDGVTPIGFDVDVAYELGSRLGLEVELVDPAWTASSPPWTQTATTSHFLRLHHRGAAGEVQPHRALHRQQVVQVSPRTCPSPPRRPTGYSVAVQTATTADDFMKAKMDAGLEVGDYYVYDKIIQCFDELKLAAWTRCW